MPGPWPSPGEALLSVLGCSLNLNSSAKCGRTDAGGWSQQRAALILLMADSNPAEAILQAQAEALGRVSGQASVPAGSEAWDDLLAFPTCLSALEPDQLAASPSLRLFCEAIGAPACQCRSAGPWPQHLRRCTDW